jgi:hypothetical protein
MILYEFFYMSLFILVFPLFLYFYNFYNVFYVYKFNIYIKYNVINEYY